MPEYVSVQIEKQERDNLQTTAVKAAKKLGLTHLSLRQLINLMHEEYKKTL